ncbi:Gfo/Idh/MocA family protein [Actinoplanes subtropicus]|uniref:Gfo/Idh/MocA family protein n=1 Tax=Actinoplanes subtropicus TaxID=543632 RepID=UPI0004C46B38|nr:Gfo/Idh/MocA family oxidoreductase [Actinoplanes subtropicus]
MTVPSAGRSEPLGVGIVGLGSERGWAAGAHLPALRAVEGFEVRGLVASTPETARRSAAKHGVPLIFDDVSALAAHPDIDLVVVAVKVPHHRELIVPALEAGTMVLSEWPLARTLTEAEDLAELAAKRETRTAVGLQSRSAPAIRYLRDLIAEGYVGEVLSTSMIGSGDAWGPTTSGRNVYALDRDNGATMLTIPLGHALDALVTCLSGFASLTATTATRRTGVVVGDTGETAPQTAEDQIAITGVLQTGAVASVHYRGGTSRATNLLWEINGTDGDLVVSGDSGHVQFGRITLRGGRGNDTTLSELPVPPRYTDGLSVSGPGSAVEHAYRQLRADIDASTVTVPDFAAAVSHHRLLDRVTRAASTGTRQ